jgi:Lrp/AsnC family leucine-responsive transcriptional regulator
LGPVDVELALDRIDWKILTALEDDGRQSFAELGERVGLSKSPCWSRVRALEQSGVIQGFKAQLSPQALGFAVQCFVQVRIEFGSHTAFEEAVLAHPAVMECHTTAGDGDYLLRIFARTVEHLDSILRYELSKLPGVQRFSSTICLKKIKSDSSLAAWASAPRPAGRD